MGAFQIAVALPLTLLQQKECRIASYGGEETVSHKEISMGLVMRQFGMHP